MIHFYIHNRPGLGYVVMRMEEGAVPSSMPVRCFGYRQSDAIEFRDDCRNGKIDDRRIKLFVDTYTNRPYKYLGNGNLRKAEMEEE